MPIQEVRVTTKSILHEPRGNKKLNEIKSMTQIASIKKIRTVRVYRFEGISEKEALFLADNLLCDHIVQIYSINEQIINDADHLIEVAYRPGMMNPEAESLLKSAADLGISTLVAADSSWEYAFYGEDITVEEIRLITDRVLVNDTVEKIVKHKPETLQIVGEDGKSKTVPIRGMNDGELMELSGNNLFLNIDEMRAIKDYFISINRDPTDCEIEILAQTWSEHCVHKTFRAKIIVDGKEKLPFLKRLQRATAKVDNPLVLSAFVDNSGVVEFYDGMAICGKVETHNSPSAIEPYGGAMTGSGGVFRDIMGTGQGAEVIASTDIFCLAHPDLSYEEIPSGCLHPRYILRRAVEGVRDYGNKMGIPTSNGSLHFHRDFRAKPTIIVGAYGLLPVSQCKKGEPQPGDLVVAIGGRTGRDGIHGATFSSGAMTDRTVTANASAVQIGHPIEEKRVSDAIQICRKKGLIRAITDCGAGGFASAVGEMGEATGVEIELDKAPLKYPGLDPWEILLSESQERMVLAVEEDKLEPLVKICEDLNVEAAVLGRFKDTGHFVATYHGKTVLNLDMKFLHDGLPERILEANWSKDNYPEPGKISVADLPSLYFSVMTHLNVCSKEPIVRMYDHGAQGTSALTPFSGVADDGPNDAAVFAPLRGKEYGAVISHGLNPILNKIDPYWGGIWASAEAVSNAVAAGASRKDLALIDNFIWPFPTEKLLGALDRAVDACVDFSLATGMPFISGKDSLSSTYHGRDGMTIEIPPVLCVSVFGRVENIRHTPSADFKDSGSVIALVGKRDIDQMAGSVLYDLKGYTGNNLPRIDLETLTRVFDSMHKAIKTGTVKACHDISEGGLAAAVAEMCFGGGLGASIKIPSGLDVLNFMFNETAGCFLVELDKATDAEELFKDVPFLLIGETRPNLTITVSYTNRGSEVADEIVTIPLAELKSSWQMPMKEVFK